MSIKCSIFFHLSLCISYFFFPLYHNLSQEEIEVFSVKYEQTVLNYSEIYFNIILDKQNDNNCIVTAYAPNNSLAIKSSNSFT